MRANFKVILLFIGLSFLLINPAHSGSRCSFFYNELLKSDEVFEEYVYPETTIGFSFDLFLDETSEDEISWELRLNNDGYPMVGRITQSKMINKVSIHDIILEVNGKDIRDYSYEDTRSLIDQLDNDKNIFLLKNSEGNLYELETNKEKIYTTDYFNDIFINYIKINDKSGTYTINYDKDFTTSIYSDHNLFNLAKEKLAIGDLHFEECRYPEEKWIELGIYDPNEGIVASNLVESDKSLQKTYYRIEAFFDEDEDEDYFEIGYRFLGTETFRNYFNLRAFPFDRQTLQLWFYQTDIDYELDNTVLEYSNYSVLKMNEFINQANPIQGWKIIDHKIYQKPFHEVKRDFYGDGIVYEIMVDRRSEYYVFKIILPIVLILIICWSAVWIVPKEIESRLTITIVCLLSLIAYNFVIDSDLPKLDYLTIMDYIILLSYIYAAIPNFLTVYSHYREHHPGKTKMYDLETLGRKYGLLSYLVLIILIVVVNTANSDYAGSSLTWFTQFFI